MWIRYSPHGRQYRRDIPGYLAHKNPDRGRTLQWPYAWINMMILGWWVFLMSKVPLLGDSYEQGHGTVMRIQQTMPA